MEPAANPSPVIYSHTQLETSNGPQELKTVFWVGALLLTLTLFINRGSERLIDLAKVAQQ